MKSNEYDVKQAVVKKLLEEGISVDIIRLEIPLSTASANGRADIVLLLDHALVCIEIKSAKDKFVPDLIEDQCKAYLKAFDYCITIVDSHHLAKKSFRHPDLWFWHQEGSIADENKKHRYIIEELRAWRKSRKTNARDMAEILWAKEAKNCGGFKTRTAWLAHVHENGSLKTVRQLVLEELKLRPANQWEWNFWGKFIRDHGTSKIPSWMEATVAMAMVSDTQKDSQSPETL